MAVRKGFLVLLKSVFVFRIASYSPSKGRKCAVLLSCWLLHLLASGYAYSMGVIFVELVRDFEAARTQTALVQSIFTALMTGGGKNVITVHFLNIRTPKEFVVITLKFEICGSTIE